MMTSIFLRFCLAPAPPPFLTFRALEGCLGKRDLDHLRARRLRTATSRRGRLFVALCDWNSSNRGAERLCRPSPPLAPAPPSTVVTLN